MNADTFFLIKVFFGVIAAIFGLSGAIFTFLDTAQNEKTERTQAWFEEKWNRINNSGWLNLPEKATRWLLDSRTRLAEWINEIQFADIIVRVLFFSIPVLFVIACFFYWGITIAIFSIFPTIPFLIYAVTNEIPGGGFSRTIKSVIALSMIASALLTTFLWLQIILRQDLYSAALITLIFIPFFWIATYIPVMVLAVMLSLEESEWGHAVLLFSTGVASGFTVTLLAMSFGHVAVPSAYVPQTLQMLISNMMFDGLTMAVTFAVLSRALSKEGMLRLPIAILLDVLIAGVFASSSLYFGLAFTDNALNAQETLYVLFARSADNSHFEFSPYFWTMHTTFIPTLLYLLLILFCWVGKALLIPVRGFFGLGQENKNPFKLTAGLCGIFAAIFTILFFVTGSVQERAKEMQAKPAQPAVIENQN